MFKMVKLVSVAAMSAGFCGVTFLPAHALSVISPAYEEQAPAPAPTYSHPPVAFTGGVGEAANSQGFALSPNEIQHVRWCAQNYTSYHATDDTIDNGEGARTACKSPY